jgi:hypothetical protein
MAEINGNGKKWLSTVRESISILVVLAALIGWAYVLSYRVTQAECDIKTLEERNEVLNNSIAQIGSDIQYIRGKLDNGRP